MTSEFVAAISKNLRVTLPGARLSRLPLLLLVFWQVGLAQTQPAVDYWQPYDESADLQAQQAHENPRMRFRLINSRYLDKDELWAPFESELEGLTPAVYERLKPLILEAGIPALQRAVGEGRLSYEELVRFYLYRIREIESDNVRSLNALIAIDPQVLETARKRDRARAGGLEVADDSLFGIPVLLKDNIGTRGMPTTAGAVVLQNNATGDAFITSRLRENGAVILGKANLSEWAYFFCSGCPLGYSATGGQTLNPYGRMVIETGGSSSGSAVAVAANLVTVAVGSETSGSILSPASLNSAVGLKPTTGMLSRTGIVPIAGSLDTAGPITRSITDAVILFNAMAGYDTEDPAMPRLAEDATLVLRQVPLTGKRLGFLAGLTENPAYRMALGSLEDAGAELVEVTLADVNLPRFVEFLGAEMQQDLPVYLAEHAANAVPADNIAQIIAFNELDLALRAPYGQALFEQMTEQVYGREETRAMLAALRGTGSALLSEPIASLNLDALLSMNNFHASMAAAANFPALTLPMGRGEDGRPVGLTLIAPGFAEQTLVDIGAAIEALLQGRQIPADYQ